MLGHQDVSTTARHYAGIADATLARVMERSDAAEGTVGSNVVPIRVVGGRKGQGRRLVRPLLFTIRGSVAGIDGAHGESKSPRLVY